MKKRLFLIMIFMTGLAFSQTENHKVAIDNFQMNYNAEKYDEIFNSFSSEMKQALPISKTQQFLVGLKKQVGKIENTEFVGYRQGTYAIYKTVFERATLAINISLDKQNQINGLFIKPYEEIKTNIVNALSDYPEKFVNIIFSKSKNLPNNAQLSIAILQNGKTDYYGIIKENDSIRPIENQSKIFEIGSITKVFTATVLAALVENKKVKLTDKINIFYPFSFKDNTKITFQSLANHTSGLPRLPKNLDLSNEANPYKNYGKNEIDEYLSKLLEISPKTYAYSNLGAGLLGHTLGISQNTDFRTLLQKNIFDKYKMTNTFTTAKNLQSKLIKGLNKEGQIVSNWDFDVLFGGGGILSTTEDLAKFADAQFNPQNTELSLTRKPTFEIDENMKIGLGWHILQSGNGADLVWHNGGTGGYSSSMAVNVKEKTAVIILSNVFGVNESIDELCFNLISEINKNHRAR